MPMATTTMAALIGFKAMGWGELTVMGGMGVMMSYGITACFLAAITAVPAILVIGERLTNKKLQEEDKKMFIEDKKKIFSKEKQSFKNIFKSKNHVKGGNRNENRKKQ
jgi:predicted RND superfamily exporter protein